MRTNNRKNSYITNNIPEVMKNRIERSKHTFRYNSDGSNYYIVDGKHLSVKEFDEMFPVEIKYTNRKGNNPDGTNNWI